MTLDLKRVFAQDGAVLPVESALDLSAMDYSGAFPLKKPVTVTGKIFNRASVVQLQLEIRYTFSAPCDRCGADTSREYTVLLEKALATSIEGEESDTILTVPGMKLDVDELVATEVFVSLPRKFLCKEDCRGICPTCGKNLNDGVCDCTHREIDPRLQKLADLLK